MDVLKITLVVVIQLAFFALAMWLNSEYGHVTGKNAGNPNINPMYSPRLPK